MPDIKIDTGAVLQTASTMESSNNQLYDLLLESQESIRSLGNSWEGSASQATIASYDSFAKKYFSEFQDIINDYVRFLRSQVDEGYVSTETSNENIGDSFLP